MRQDIKKNAKRRLGIIAGQVKAVQAMVDEEKYCVDIITQIEAAQGALAGVKTILLENHIGTHVLHQMKHGEENKAMSEIVKIYKLAQKQRTY